MLETQIDKRIFKMHAEVCKTLANPTRLEILSLLRTEERSVNELTTITGVRQATISQHLTVLRQRGVVSTRREGLNIFYKISNPKITQACDIMREVLFEQIDEMEKLAKEAR